MGMYHHPVNMNFDGVSFNDLINNAFIRAQDKQIVKKIQQKDHSLWRGKEDNIKNRLGWVDLPRIMDQHIARIEQLAKTVSSEGYSNVILLGMGGSSLVSILLEKTFEKIDGFPDLMVIDSTLPDTLTNVEKNLNLSKSIFIVATKSGETLETISLFKYFYNKVVNTVVEGEAGHNFVAITDPETSLAKIGSTYNFREVFLNEATIGGRYSALSFFGLVPASLMGLNIRKLLFFGQLAQQDFYSLNYPLRGRNCAVDTGVILGVLEAAGKDKLTIITSSGLESFGDWLEQLVAESTGKVGKGLIPVVREILFEPEFYTTDRVFIYMKLGDDCKLDRKVAALKQAGFPILTYQIFSLYELGAHFFMWQMAVAILAIEMSINPFDQPDVEITKAITNEIIRHNSSEGDFSKNKETIDKSFVLSDKEQSISSVKNKLLLFIDSASKQSYIGIQVYLSASERIITAVESLRKSIGLYSGLVTTVGFGPRYLHSTGQLHKGGNGNCCFLQIVSNSSNDLSIPDQLEGVRSTLTFGELTEAQSLGDRRALLDKGRPVFRIIIEGELARIINVLASRI